MGADCTPETKNWFLDVDGVTGAEPCFLITFRFFVCFFLCLWLGEGCGASVISSGRCTTVVVLKKDSGV